MTTSTMQHRPNANGPAIGSLWQQTAIAGKERSRLADDITCDVAIVGAGFTGLRCALALAEAGLNPIVLDAQDVGFGASGRNGGQVNPMLPVERPNDLRKSVGNIFFERLAEISLGSADALFALIKKYKIDCGARQKGWLRVAHCETAKVRWRAAAKAWNEFGAGFEFLEGNELQKWTGSPAYASAVFSPKGGAIQPLSLVRGLAAAAENAGATIYPFSPCGSLLRDGDHWRLSVGKHQVLAKAVVLATNGYSDGLLPGLKNSVLPLVSIQIATDPLDEDKIGAILPKGQTISDTRRSIMYARREPGNQMVYGGIGHQSLTGRLGGFQKLKNDAENVFPSLKGANWRYQWGGKLAVTSDHIPHLHEPYPGIIAGLGFNGRGVAMSHVMGKVLADRVLGKPASDLPIPVTGIKPIPFRNVQLLGSPIAIGLMAMRDKLEFQV